MSVPLDGQKIRELRIREGWSREDLAAKAGCSRKTVENVEAGKSAQLRTMSEIAAALGVQNEELLVATGGDDVSSDGEIELTLLGSVPPIPPLLIGRDQVLRNLKERLTHSPLGEQGQRLTVVHGWPGVGKTTVAAALAHDRDLATVFTDGVLWVSVGQEPDVLAELASCGRALGTQAIQHARTVQEASQRLAALIQDKRMLLVIDDAWKVEDAIPFRVGGRSCATLVTTRLSSVAERLSPTPDDSYNLEVLDEAGALALLQRLAPDVVERHANDARELVRELEGLPLAIEVAGRLLNTHYRRWESERTSGIATLLGELKDGVKILQETAPANMVALLKETTPNVATLLKRSTDALDEQTRERFAYLGAFAPKPAKFDLKLMAGTWKVAETEARQIADKLIDYGLLEPVEDGWFWIHALLVSHAKTLWT